LRQNFNSPWSGSAKAKIDVFCSLTDSSTAKTNSCAIELKYFKKENQREPNNRYDCFVDIMNLEDYGAVADCCFLIVATDHNHYVNHKAYSKDTADFDFRHNSLYKQGTMATYRTPKPYGPPITLKGSYSFLWDTAVGGHHFMKLEVVPKRGRRQKQ
jgi:hypothetical protein